MTKFNLLLKTAWLAACIAGINGSSASAASDPQITSWITAFSGKYARVYTNDVSRTNGASRTTWTNSSTATIQAVPTYCGVQAVYFSSNWIYVRTPDLAEYTMGPWYNDSTRTTLFIALPTNQHAMYVLPRTATLTNPPAAKTVTFGAIDVIGYFNDGVAMFDALDGFVWNGTNEQSGGNYQWRRAAYPNENITFDPGYSHQQNSGEYHNHADPIALRYTLGDHVTYNATTKTYAESTATPTQHSPILGWVRDGYPLYGPYGYANPTNAASGIRRMVSGYQLRDGQHGSDNETNVGRAVLPAWMLRNNNNTAQTGPPVNTNYPVGRYLQDYAYLGDLTNSATGTNFQPGTDFDLNEFDARWCVTPDFPNGTYAYFVTIDTNGTPIAPWNVGMFFYGSPTGYKGTNVTETVTTNFTGAPNLTPVLNSPAAKTGTVTLSWSATEGGTYMVESTTNFIAWTTNTTNVVSVLNAASYTTNASSSHAFYRVTQVALAAYDSVLATTNSGGGNSQGISTVAPTSGTHGTTATLTITLNASFVPPPPPDNDAPTSVTLTGPATLAASSFSRNGTTGVVTASFTLPANAATGAYTINCVFGPNTWSLINGYTVN